MFSVRTLLRRSLFATLSILLLFSSMTFFGVHTSIADAATTKAAPPPPIRLGKTAVVQISNVDLFTQVKGLYLIFSLKYTNNGTTSIALDDYWANVKTTKGKTFSIKVADKDKNVKSLSGKSSVNVTYYAEIDEGLTLSQLQIQLIKWDFGVANFTRQLGAFNLAKGYGAATAAFQPYNIVTKETKLKTAIKSVQTALEGEDRVFTITYWYENLNSREYKASNNLFYIMTSDGSIYDATSNDLKDLAIKPKQNKTISLKANLPSSVSTNGMKMIMGYQSEADALFIPNAVYQLPKASDLVIPAGVSQMTYNLYHFELLGYNRLPSGAQDSLTANFKITNKSTVEQKVPTLKSTWSINGVVQESKAPVVTAFDSRMQLAPGESIQMAANIFLPYTVSLKDVQVILKETIDPQNDKTIGNFKSAKINQFQVSSDPMASFDRMGSRAQVELLKVYTSSNGKLMSILGEMAVTNLEVRPNNLQKYGLYIKAGDGQIYPLTVLDYDSAIISNGRVIVPFSGKVPVTAKDSAMNILITELLPYAADAANKDQAIATRVVSMSTAWPETQPNTKFSNLVVGKYNFTFDKAYVYLDMMDYASIRGLNLEFEYTMLADPKVDDMAGIYKLRFEIEDQEAAKTTYFKEYVLNGKDKTDDFKEAQTLKKKIQFSDTAILDKISNFTNSKLSVYYVVNDEKILLAQRLIPYFSIQLLNQ